jgi:hypothetical protein
MSAIGQKMSMLIDLTAVQIVKRVGSTIGWSQHGLLVFLDITFVQIYLIARCSCLDCRADQEPRGA